MLTSDPVTTIPGIGPSYQKLLEKLGAVTVGDLLNHFPRKYLDFSQPTNISSLRPYSTFCLRATVVSGTSLRTRAGKTMQKIVIRDHTGTLTLTWFNQPFILSTLKPDQEFFFVGTTKDSTYFVTPLLQEPATAQTLHTNRIVPFHPLTGGLSGKWLRHKIHLALASTNLPEVLPPSIISQYRLASLGTAYSHIHFPQNPSDLHIAQTRFAFDDLLTLHLQLQKTKRAWQQLPTLPILTDTKLHQQFLDSLPFSLTPDQSKTISAVHTDLAENFPANRLIQGDVGSGKTIIAVAAALQAINAGLRVLVLAPTQILASQHCQTFSRFLSPFSITPTLITSGAFPKSLSPLLIGTHALLLPKYQTDLSSVGLVVLDEQQRFGVLQRNFFVSKTHTPHHLTLSATPIPRTIALSLVGHLDISNIKTLPAQKKPIKTWLVPEAKRAAAYTWIGQEIHQHHVQVFFVCPAIDPQGEADAGSTRSATRLHQLLQKTVFPRLRVGLLHGRLKKADQQAVIQDYQEKRLDILVSTTVIEVGIDIKNANIMVIESAEHFGLSQLHQLRGRVGRGVEQGYCLLFASGHADGDQISRLKHLENSTDGFALARLDLKLRGAGSLFGTHQSGHLHTHLTEFWSRSLSKKAQSAAVDLMSHHPTHPLVVNIPPSINLQT
ncbi:hypothetical protein A2368_02490 [Candidatus Collierbacteria bacterium RIFOXYB1_FULL_49_13]|uniref:Uncharacterized protein n=1 Tax=Candidatus Collierbacteria bacterium RIFOXYB1_FULL_49_13 TaxID=1817728 RepID=A0A1F5FJX8_9BACT|nr:MAG: hypothetical protein A2368_02490 [Candidatus Collierbacteria bacterium RIFOXYB1_FULL_49_13]